MLLRDARGALGASRAEDDRLCPGAQPREGRACGGAARLATRRAEAAPLLQPRDVSAGRGTGHRTQPHGPYAWWLATLCARQPPVESGQAPHAVCGGPVSPPIRPRSVSLERRAWGRLSDRRLPLFQSGAGHVWTPPAPGDVTGDHGAHAPSGGAHSCVVRARPLRSTVPHQ